MNIIQGFCNCLVFIHCINFCNTLKEQTIVGIIMSLLGNSGTFYIYAFGLFLNWRQLALVASLSAVPYVMGMIFVLPDDFPYQIRDTSGRKHKRFENVSFLQIQYPRQCSPGVLFFNMGFWVGDNSKNPSKSGLFEQKVGVYSRKTPKTGLFT